MKWLVETFDVPPSSPGHAIKVDAASWYAARCLAVLGILPPEGGRLDREQEARVMDRAIRCTPAP